jgi:hypothetical protein
MVAAGTAVPMSGYGVRGCRPEHVFRGETDHMDIARLSSIQVGLPRTLGSEDATEPDERPWTTGSFKVPAEGPIYLRYTNLGGDGQADLRNHGGADKAVCVYASQHYPFWRRELGIADFHYGAFGENFTLDGLTEPEVCIGDVYAVGNARVQVSQPRQRRRAERSRPCRLPRALGQLARSAGAAGGGVERPVRHAPLRDRRGAGLLPQGPGTPVRSPLPSPAAGRAAPPA